MAAVAIDCRKESELDSEEDSSRRPKRQGAVVGGLFASRYRIESRIAQGGQGCVWLATDEADEDGRRVALKIIGSTRTQNDSVRDRFQRETQIAASLVGPHFVRVHAQGIHGGDAYMVMEHLEGEDLHTRLRRCQLGIAETRAILRAVTEGLTVAHAAGVIHRDLKPRNIFLARRDDGPDVVKILDFGVAKGGGGWELETEPGTVLGSPHYMSPEQSRGGQGVDHRSDLWSLAATAYRCLTGTTPFEGDLCAVILQLQEAEPRPASRLVPTLPASFDDFFRVALARDPAARHQSAAELADAFERAADEATRDECGPMPERSPMQTRTGETVIFPIAELDTVVSDSGSYFAHTPEGSKTLDGGRAYQIFATCSQFPGPEEDEEDAAGDGPTLSMKPDETSPWSVYVDRASVPTSPTKVSRRFSAAAYADFVMLCFCFIMFAIFGLGRRSFRR